MDLKLKGKTALVMGSSQGIGRAISESLIAEGVKVAICSRSIDSLKSTAEQIGASYFEACDLSVSGAAEKLCQNVLKEFGQIDILVTNTGGPAKGGIAEVSSEQWQQDFQSIWMSVVESLKVTLPAMKERKYGRVLLVTSLAAKQPLPGLTTSNGLRAGLAGLVRSVANEVAADGITLNLLLPGYTNTDRLKQLNLSDEKIKQMVPAARLGEPHELADLATFLASPRAAYITAQSIAVDGGVLKGIF